MRFYVPFNEIMDGVSLGRQSDRNCGAPAISGGGPTTDASLQWEP